MARMNWRTSRRISLMIATSDQRKPRASDSDAPAFPWYAAAVAGSVGAALGGWLVIAGVIVLAWLSAMTMNVGTSVLFATSVWVAAHGGGIRVGTAVWTVAPLLLTLIAALLLAGVAGYAVLQDPGARQPAASLRDKIIATARVCAVSTLTYAVIVGAVALVVTDLAHAFTAMAGAGVVALIATLTGAVRASTITINDVLPAWAHRILPAIAAACALVLLVASVALTFALWVGLSRMQTLEQGLLPTGTGVAVIALAQALFLPNLLAWSGSYVLGAGFSVGVGTVVSPTAFTVGLLPAIPVLGAIPPAQVVGPWGWAWLLTAVAAGVVGAVIALGRQARDYARGLGIGAGVGAITGMLWVTFAALSGGDLGSGRLVGFGPRILTLLLLAPTTMAASGAVAAAVVIALHRHRARTRVEQDLDEATIDISGDATITLGEPVGADWG